jgi:hypothetical protein
MIYLYSFFKINTQQQLINRMSTGHSPLNIKCFERRGIKKKLERAQIFSLFLFLFVTPAGFEPATIRAEI